MNGSCFSEANTTFCIYCDEMVLLFGGFAHWSCRCQLMKWKGTLDKLCLEAWRSRLWRDLQKLFSFLFLRVDMMSTVGYTCMSWFAFQYFSSLIWNKDILFSSTLSLGTHWFPWETKHWELFLISYALHTYLDKKN
jgi:hypothetical protein